MPGNEVYADLRRTICRGTGGRGADPAWCARRRTRGADAADFSASSYPRGDTSRRSDSGPHLPAFRADRIEEYAARQSAIRTCGSLPAADVRRAEAVANLLRPRVRSTLGVVDAEKLIEAADKAPPPSPGVSPLHVTEAGGARQRSSALAVHLRFHGDPKASCSRTQTCSQTSAPLAKWSTRAG